MSGIYVWKGPTAAVMLQMVEMGGGKFTGRYEKVTLQTDGQIEDRSATIIGVRDGQTVVATMKVVVPGPLGLYTVSLPVSGTYHDGVLHLTAGANLVSNLSRGSEDDFRSQVTALMARGQQIREAIARQRAAQRQAKVEAEQEAEEAKVEAARLSKLQDLTGRMAAFDAKVDGMLQKFAPLRQQWRQITEWMHGALARQRFIPGGWQTTVARTKITLALNQAALKSNQIHINVQTAFQSFDFNSSQLGREAVVANGWCQGSVPDSLSDACERFLAAQTAFAKHTSAARAAFADLEAVWTSERREQDTIVQASQRLQ